MDDEGGKEPHSIRCEEEWEDVAADLAALSDDLEQPVRLTCKEDGRQPDSDMGQPPAAVLSGPDVLEGVAGAVAVRPSLPR